MREAKRTINFTAYIWEPGKVSDQFFEVMTERARAGVEVRVLLDGLGRPACARGQDQAAHGGRRATCAGFRPMRLGGLTRFHRRNHRRAIVIDGAVAFTGGAAIGDKWLGNARNPEEWRDTMVKVTGPARAQRAVRLRHPLGAVRGGDADGRRALPAARGAGAGGGEGGLPHLASPARPRARTIRCGLFYMLSFLAARQHAVHHHARTSCRTSTRAAAVAGRARAGVDVRILLPNKLTDAMPIRQASHSYYDELLEAGVRIYEYQPAMMHAKMVVVDGLWSVVGSANMDIRSKELNQENVLGILDEGFGRQVQETFLADLEQAQEIRLEDWKRRGLWPRVKERVSRDVRRAVLIAGRADRGWPAAWNFAARGKEMRMNRLGVLSVVLVLMAGPACRLGQPILVSSTGDKTTPGTIGGILSAVGGERLAGRDVHAVRVGGAERYSAVTQRDGRLHDQGAARESTGSRSTCARARRSSARPASSTSTGATSTPTWRSSSARRGRLLGPIGQPDPLPRGRGPRRGRAARPTRRGPPRRLFYVAGSAWPPTSRTRPRCTPGSRLRPSDTSCTIAGTRTRSSGCCVQALLLACSASSSDPCGGWPPPIARASGR